MACCQDVHQETGEDLNPNRRRNRETGVGEEAMRNPDRPAEGSVVEMQENPTERKRLAKITDLEKWEITQVWKRVDVWVTNDGFICLFAVIKWRQRTKFIVTIKDILGVELQLIARRIISVLNDDVLLRYSAFLTSTFLPFR